MAGRSFRLEIVTPDRLALADDTVTSLVLPGSEGYFGVLAGHAPLLAELKVGEIDVTRADKSETAIATSGGFVEVGGNRVIVLADTAESADEIDVSRAEEARKRAEERLRRRSEEEVDAGRAQAALLRAINRLHVASHGQR